MKIKFAKPGINAFGKKRLEPKDDSPEPNGILDGTLPQTIREFANFRGSTPAKEREHYRRHLEARDSAEIRRLDRLLNATVAGVITTRASALTR